MNRKFMALLLLALSPSAFAHEGHGTIENLWAHYAFEPGHGLALVVVLLVAAGVWRRTRRHQNAEYRRCTRLRCQIFKETVARLASREDR